MSFSSPHTGGNIPISRNSTPVFQNAATGANASQSAISSPDMQHGARIYTPPSSGSSGSSTQVNQSTSQENVPANTVSSPTSPQGFRFRGTRTASTVTSNHGSNPHFRFQPPASHAAVQNDVFGTSTTGLQFTRAASDAWNAIPAVQGNRGKRLIIMGPMSCPERDVVASASRIVVPVCSPSPSPPPPPPPPQQQQQLQYQPHQQHQQPQPAFAFAGSSNSHAACEFHGCDGRCAYLPG